MSAKKDGALAFLLSLPRRLVVLLIRGYQQVISPLFPPTCRFAPSCSSYAATALQRFGLFKGGWLAVKRIVRCNPWNNGGYDPVPEKFRFWASRTKE